MNKKELIGLRYYIALASILLMLYIYSMTIGYRLLSFGESSHQNNTNNKSYRNYSHSFNHK